MEFSAWSWASHFRLHEAACLIAGVVPISKNNPTTEELPSQARPPLTKLAGAYYEWFLQAKNPERPKSIALEGIPNADGSLPPFPTPKEVSGEIVSREAIQRFVSLMAERGFKSCYDFGPIGKAGPPHEVGHQNHAATPVPVMAASDAKPWLSIDPQDPAPAQPWYTPARYFARQLTIEKPALLTNRTLLADKVSTALFNAGVKKRGGKERFDSGTVLKAFANVSLG